MTIFCKFNMFDAKQAIYLIHPDNDVELIHTCYTNDVGHSIASFISATSFPISTVQFSGEALYCQMFETQIKQSHPNIIVKVI